MELKNKTIRINGNSFGTLSLTVYDKIDGKLEHNQSYKFDGFMENVNLEILIPKGCRKEYAKIVK